VRAGIDQATNDQRSVQSVLDMLTQNTGRRGSWGEVTLRRLLENSGLVHLVDFDTQKRLPNGTRPDVVVDLGGGSLVVIDAKAPLDDLKAAFDADTKAARQAAVKRHVATVRRHASDLATRDYAAALDAAFAPVVMYLPVDGAWETAIDHSSDLAADLHRLGIHPASPSTLGLVLAIVKQHALDSNRQEAMLDILGDTKRLLDTLGKHTDHLSKMGRALETAVRAYNEGVGNFSTRVLPATARMSAHLSLGEPESPASIESMPSVERVPVGDGRIERVA
jgi:DNA recombination protein RmuC